MTPFEALQLEDRAEFYLCLSRAFLTPDSDEAWRGMREALADDLEEISESLGYDISSHLGGYRAAIAMFPEPASLLQAYSRLFLSPPCPVGINAGSYLDGAVNGGSVLEMEASYRRCGLERSEGFRDLSDHVAIQLEFVASRYLAESGEADAEAFLGSFVAHWLPCFIIDLQKEQIMPNPWLHLARALRDVVAADVNSEAGSAARSRQQTSIDKARHDRALQGVGDEDMAFIAQRLREKGLSVDHLSIPPERRDEAHGWSRKVTPSPRRGSRLG